ncbi:MAG: DNA topoisomerase III [Methylococcales bacterium]
MANKIQNTYELYLCEKPSQGRDIARILGANRRNEGYLQGDKLIVSWCIGHLLEMIPPDGYNSKYKRWSLADLPIVPKDWKMAPKKSTSKQLTVLKKLLKNAHSVVIATDADREGETIAREVMDYFKYRGPSRRLWLSALDTVSVQRALNDIRPSKDTEPLYYSGLARGRADWLIGMNLTRAYTLLANDRQVRSVGRVQTPTLALIVKRDRDILNFKAVTYYEIQAYFKTNNGFEGEMLETKWQLPKVQDEETKQCLDIHIAQAVIDRCQQQTGKVTTATTARKKQPAPLLYNLSGLQQEASRRWGYGAQEVLNIAQALYETYKLTSYPRTDCEYLPLSQFSDVSQILKALLKNDTHLNDLINQADKNHRSRVWNDKKITAHHAIIPTQATLGITKLNAKEFNLYNLIRRRYIAQFFPDFEYDQSNIVVTIKNDQFKTSGRIAKVKGWKLALEGDARKLNTKADINNKELPLVKKGELLLCEHLKLLDKLTVPPKHYTEGTLIKAMETIGLQVADKVMKKILRETAGLGTQATRANIIQTLFQRKFIQQEKKVLKATTLGFNLIDVVPSTLKDPLLTAQWEQQLDDIANNKGQDLSGFLQQQISLLKSIVTLVKNPAEHKTGLSVKYKEGEICPKCGNKLEIRRAIRGGKVGQDYIGCNNFPSCRFYFWP